MSLVTIKPIDKIKTNAFGPVLPTKKYSRKDYWTNSNSNSLFSVIRSCIRESRQHTLVSLLNGHYSVGNHPIFITNRSTALRAQEILIRAQKLDRKDAYSTCSDLIPI